MRTYQRSVEFLVREISVITGLNISTINKSDIPFIDSVKVPKTNRPSKVIPIQFFEMYLEECKVWSFEIVEFKKYKEKKRPIIRHFLSVRETAAFMKIYGLELHIRTIHKKILREEIPAYKVKGLYLIPIIFLIKAFVIEIDEDLNRNVSTVINEPYQFQL